MVVMAAAPWYPSELPPASASDPKKVPNYFSSELGLATKLSGNGKENDLDFIFNRQDKKGQTRNGRSLWAMNSIRNIIVMSNNIFRLPEREQVENVKTVEQLEEEEEEETIYHSGLVNKAFLPMRLAMLALGRWPYPMRMIPVTNPKKQHKSGLHHHHHRHHQHRMKRVRNYVPTWRTFLLFYYAGSTAFILYVLVMSTIGFFNFFLGWDFLSGFNWVSKHSTIFTKNLVLFLLLWGNLVHSTLSSFSFLAKRNQFIRILNYWNVAVEELMIDEVKSHRRAVIVSHLGFVVFLILIYISYSTWKVEFVRAGAELFGSLAILPLLSLVTTDIDIVEGWQLRVFGIVIMIYGVYASRCFLFFFSFKCRLLKSLFRLWNGRLTQYLKTPDYEHVTNEKEKDELDAFEKMESERLMKDMAILLKLVKAVDKLFATVMPTYYGIQLLNMCFELYMIAGAGSKRSDKNEEGREMSIFASIVLLCQNVYFFFTVSLDGAHVGEEAEKGMEMLRRHALKPTSNVHRKYLVYNLGFIYNQKITLSGGHYFNIDRPFIITVLGAVLTYFVIILQVGPNFQRDFVNNTTPSSVPELES